MRKIIALSVIFLFCCAEAAFSQVRNIDLEVLLAKPAPNTNLEVGVPFEMEVYIINNGPDSILLGDTVFFAYSSLPNAYGLMGFNKKAGDTIIIKRNLNIASASSDSLNFCAVAMIRNGTDITDSNTDNNQSCNLIRLNGTSGITELIGAGNKQSKLDFFPNPASSTIELNHQLERTARIALAVMDMTGRKVLHRDLGVRMPGELKATLDITGLPPGMYIVSLQGEEVMAIGKLNIQR